MPGRVRAYRLRTSMVRRGSTVRVRQRALQSAANRRFLFREYLHDLQRAVGMEPSGSERALEVSEMDALAGKICRMAPSRHEQDGLHSAVLAGDPTAPPRVFELLLEPLIERSGSSAS